jgi:hypothetical protein
LSLQSIRQTASWLQIAVLPLAVVQFPGKEMRGEAGIDDDASLSPTAAIMAIGAASLFSREPDLRRRVGRSLPVGKVDGKVGIAGQVLAGSVKR